jgi:hypothetical protein
MTILKSLTKKESPTARAILIGGMKIRYEAGNV